MNYLKEYNITEEQIKDILSVLEKNNINSDLFIYDPEKIIAVLNLFKEIGVTNFYGIIITNPYMFLDTVDSIKIRLNKYENLDELSRLINEDPKNLYLVDLGF